MHEESCKGSKATKEYGHFPNVEGDMKMIDVFTGLLLVALISSTRRVTLGILIKWQRLMQGVTILAWPTPLALTMQVGSLTLEETLEAVISAGSKCKRSRIASVSCLSTSSGGLTA